MISADTLQNFLPQRDNSRSMALIPAGLPGSSAGSDLTATERDILYKLFFDLKKDMNDLKAMFFDVVHHQNISPSSISENLLPVYNSVPESQTQQQTPYNPSTPILIQSNDNHEDVEETLLLAEREKEFITKALKKHKGRRRDAANELGISERTLYRKIKEYDIEE